MRILFNRFALDLDTRQLTDGGHEVRVTPKAFELLVALALERPKVLSKVELQQRLWPDTFVAEANLSNLVAELRDALGDVARAPLFIRTAHGFGYAFCADATTPPPPSAAADGPPLCWLEWDTRRVPLSAGSHVVGRGADVEINIDSSTVSRRHARIVVTRDTATLEDFGSKNGTSRGDERVTQPVSLADGDTIRVGSVLLTYRRRSPTASTDTHVVSAS